MKNYKLNRLTNAEYRSLINRPAINFDKIFDVVKPILNDIKKDGITAAKNYAKKFDDFDGDNLQVTNKEFDEAEKKLDAQTKKALKDAAKNIEKFHVNQNPGSYEIETVNGVICSREFRAIENVGLYIPGGSAILPSTMLMLGIPARIAGCQGIRQFRGEIGILRDHPVHIVIGYEAGSAA